MKKTSEDTCPRCSPVTTLGFYGGNSSAPTRCFVAAEAHQRDKLERLCRYISRPAVSEKRLALTWQSKVRYQLKTPYRDGTTY